MSLHISISPHFASIGRGTSPRFGSTLFSIVFDAKIRRWRIGQKCHFSVNNSVRFRRCWKFTKKDARMAQKERTRPEFGTRFVEFGPEIERNFGTFGHGLQSHFCYRSGIQQKFWKVIWYFKNSVIVVDIWNICFNCQWVILKFWNRPELDLKWT